MKKIHIIIFTGVVVFIVAGFYIDQTLRKDDGSIGNKFQEVTNQSTVKPTNGKGVDFHDYGSAPEVSGIEKWLNSDPLTMQSLRGKVVLIDFWTYSCINCIRTLPHVTQWYDAYKDKGFVVIGVHTPEFAFEKNTQNVQDAIKHFKIRYPVAQDNAYQTWSNYHNQYWPAEYLINQDGTIVYTHFGEGNYDHTENAIRSLLGLNPMAEEGVSASWINVQSPEMYFGLSRLENLTGAQKADLSEKRYEFPQSLPLNTFALEGDWQFSNQSAHLLKSGGKIKLKFSSGKVHFVASSVSPATLKITVDGKQQEEVVVKESKLYTLFDSNDYSEHTIEIEIDGAGFEAFTFTFG